MISGLGIRMEPLSVSCHKILVRGCIGPFVTGRGWKRIVSCKAYGGLQ